MPAKTIEFWFDFASTYSYLSATRIGPLATAAGLTIAWKPFLLGPIFKAQGWTTSPFNLYPAKGRNMVRDLERLSADRGLPFKLPDPFPQNSILAARVALVGVDAPWGVDVVKAIYRAEFGEGRSIADADALAPILARVGADPVAVLAQAGSVAVKARLRTQTDQAASLGIFGAPTIRTPDNELFWGDDRLEFAVKWTQQL